MESNPVILMAMITKFIIYKLHILFIVSHWMHGYKFYKHPTNAAKLIKNISHRAKEKP